MVMQTPFIVVATCSALLAIPQTTRQTPAVEILMTVEARRVSGATWSEQTAQVIAALFPKAIAQLRYVTDGRGVRNDISGGYYGLADGATRVVKPNDDTIYVLDHGDKTFYLVSPQPFGGKSTAPLIDINKTNETKTVAGMRATRVTVRYSQTVDTSSVAPTGVTAKPVAATIEQWCTNSITVPRAMLGMMDVVQRLAKSGDVSYSGVCRLPLESYVTISVLPGVEIVTKTLSIRKTSASEADFTIPPDYARRAR